SLQKAYNTQHNIRPTSVKRDKLTPTGDCSFTCRPT
ncbi:MAG TPA: hypothetical protein ENI08_03250, partial [Candidatus Dependentiae bacterium]|nr:hypothetical protein [Candidatus Dependentiae bacterium]